MACARADLVLRQDMSETKIAANTDSEVDAASEKIEKKLILKIRGAVSNAAAATTMAIDNTTASTADGRLSGPQTQNHNYRFKLSSNGFSSNTEPNEGDLFTHKHDTLSINHDTGEVMCQDLVAEDELPQIPMGNRLPSPCPQDERIVTVRRKPNESQSQSNYDWSRELNDAKFFAASVSCFEHAPGHEVWTDVGVGMIVEVENTDCGSHGLQSVVAPNSFWMAAVVRLSGYKALLRYEGFDNDSSHDFWVNLCSSEVHPVGWCAIRGKPLIPPRSIVSKFDNFKQLLVERLSGARTLPATFYSHIADSLKSRFRCGLQLEVVNKNRISQMRLATVQKIVGKRLLVRYFDAPDDVGFWVHEDSPLIHPVGWSTKVGHDLAAPPEYLERMCAGRKQTVEERENDATMDLFKSFTFEDGKKSVFRAGMKLEAVDPLNLSSICVATIMEVLKFGYLMIRIDSYDPDATGADLFCYHEKSACILPPGFCKKNNVALTPPKGYDRTTFSWPQYLADTKSTLAGEKLFQRDALDNGFAAGMKIECADLMDPRLVCVATVAKTVDRLVKVHFDGWEDDYDQWLDARSPDMYPVGWCALVGHKLEGPPMSLKPMVVQKPVPKLLKRGRGKHKKKGDAKGKSRGGTPTSGGSARSSTAKAKEVKSNDVGENSSGRRGWGSHRDSTEIGDNLDDDDDDDDFSNDDYSLSIASMPSLPATPEPRNNTPTQQPTTRPSSKMSSISMSSTSSSLPSERKATSSTNSTATSTEKFIPRLVDTSAQQQNSINDLSPDTWSVHDVGQFLRLNDCNTHYETFGHHKIDGKRLLKLTKDEIVEMLSMKVGPALKIYDLIQQLKVKLKSSRLSNRSSWFP